MDREEVHTKTNYTQKRVVRKEGTNTCGAELRTKKIYTKRSYTLAAII